MKGRAIKVTKDEYMDVCELQCSQEEADTRMVLYAPVAANEGAKRIEIKSPDTASSPIDQNSLSKRFSFSLNE